MELKFPNLSLVVLMGVSSSGKTSFAKKHFLPTQIVSSDTCRALVADDEANQEATGDAFDLLHHLVGLRLKRGLLTVVDATNIHVEGRKQLVRLAKQYHYAPVLIALDVPVRTLLDRHRLRTDRSFSERVIENQRLDFRNALRGRELDKEGFKNAFILGERDIDDATIHLTIPFSIKKEVTGPFDIIGDVHGCFVELLELLQKLGYSLEKNPVFDKNTEGPPNSNHRDKIEESLTQKPFIITNPEGRVAVFVGDLVDRGPNSPDVLRLVMQMVEEQKAWCVVGNHDDKLKRFLDGRDVKLQHGLEQTAEQLRHESDGFKQKIRRFLDKLISHYVFDDGKLVVAHAGCIEEMQGRISGAVRSFCMYGETSGEIDEFGLPVRYNWAATYKGKATVIYGHTPVPTAEWLNNTMDIDTGCVFGGKLTAFRYPEREVVSVAARMEYAVPKRPLSPPQSPQEGDILSLQQTHDDILDIEDILSKQIIETRLLRNIIIREENTAAALETMSRFAMNPKWLVYLPPTMSPSETSTLPDYLEHPREAFDYYRRMGVETVICEEKHMGSRAVVIVCKEESVANKRFGVVKAALGTCYTRTGRQFFTDENLENAFFERLNMALTAANFWGKHNTDWVILDCELMPWSAKAQGLIQSQYAATGSSAKHALEVVLENVHITKERGVGIENLENVFQNRADSIEKFIKSYQNYCRDTEGLSGWVLAPFHILATEGVAHTDKNHLWHMENIADFCRFDTDLLLATPYKIAHLKNEIEAAEAEEWWTAMTEKGGEGMVVKPLDFIARKASGDLIQPAIKCRGREYLRIIYGAEYTLDKNILRLKERGLSKKRNMALREFALGVEGLERFVRREPLRKVHQCVFGVLAMESEEVDPRL
jgi:protein phosphatase